MSKDDTLAAYSGVNGPTGTLLDGLIGGKIIDELMSSAPSVREARADECPHCFRQRHPEPLTLQQAQMYDNHKFDAGYDAESDDSKQVCIGSDYEGPRYHLAPVTYTEVSWSSTPTSYTFATAFSTAVWTAIGEVFPAEELKLDVSTWLPPFEEAIKLEPCTPDYLPIVYNDPNNWKPWEKPWYPLTAALDLKWQEWMQSFPAPKSPGYDFKAIKNQVEGYTYPTMKGTA